MPFPFLISTVIIILLSFLLKYNFTKMFPPFFIYNFAGLMEICCLFLWTILAILWNINHTPSYPIVHIVNTPIVVVGAYYLLNSVQLICLICRVKKDRKYAIW